MSQLDGLSPYSTEGQILLHIARDLEQIKDALQGLAPAGSSEQPAAKAAGDSPVAGEPEKKPAAKKAAKKATTRKRVTGQ